MVRVNAVISITTYPKRFNRFAANFPSVFEQDIFKYLNNIKVVVNVDDNLTDDEYKRYEDFVETMRGKIPEGRDVEIELKKREARWRSANKYIFVGFEYPDSPVIVVDDDIHYNEPFLLWHLYQEWLRDQSLIVCHEANPIYFGKNYLNIYNSVVLKIGNKGFDKYLTNCCLFPPSALKDTDAMNWEAFDKFCNCTHDELWFWIHTTIKGIRVKVINDVVTFVGDGNCPPDSTALCRVNEPLWNEYTKRINAFYIDKISKSIGLNYVEFYVDNDSMWGYLGRWRAFVQLYDKPFKVKFVCSKDLSVTHFKTLLNNIVTSKLCDVIVECEEFDDVCCDVDKIDRTAFINALRDPVELFKKIEKKDYMNSKKI